MADKTEGQLAFESDVVLALRLLNEGHTPEEVEQALEDRRRAARAHTAVSEPKQEVNGDGTRGS